MSIQRQRTDDRGQMILRRRRHRLLEARLPARTPRALVSLKLQTDIFHRIRTRKRRDSQDRDLKARRAQPSVLRLRSSVLRTWWSQTGSNRRPHACKARALPTELWPRGTESRQLVVRIRRPTLVGLGGLEPPTSRLSSARSNQLSYKPWRPEDGSNLRPQLSSARSHQLSFIARSRKRDEDGGSRQCGL